MSRDINATDILEALSTALRIDGFDLCLPFGAAPLVDRFDALGVALPENGNPLAAIIGNSRVLWPNFLRGLREQGELTHLEHPLDTWVEQRIRSATAKCPVSAAVYFAHRPLLAGYLPLQAWAKQFGCLALSPSHLSVHRDFGPWIALRAFVLFDVDAGPSPHLTLDNAPCGTCDAPCRVPFESAASASAQSLGSARVTGHWQQWLAVRDACPIGREHRYDDAQIRYHYSRDRSVLT